MPIGCTARIRDQAIAAWSLGPAQVADGDARYTHTLRWGVQAGGALLLETFEHSYETVADGPQSALKGHCIPGSNFDPYAPQYAANRLGPRGRYGGGDPLEATVRADAGPRP